MAALTPAEQEARLRQAIKDAAEARPRQDVIHRPEGVTPEVAASLGFCNEIEDVANMEQIISMRDDYAAGRFGAVVEHWCHERFQIERITRWGQDGERSREDMERMRGWWTGTICSHQVVAPTPDECVKLMADHVMEQLKRGSMGC